MKSEYKIITNIISENTRVLDVGCNDGCLMERGTVYEIIKKAKHPYTKGLLSSIPKADQTGRLQTIKGSIRGPYDYTQGCPFVDRCDLRIDKCKDSFPSETVTSETHSFFCHRN